MTTTKSLEELRNDLLEASERAREIVNAIKAVQAQTVVMCSKCKRGREIKDIDYIQTHFYIEPSGCTGGDYWNEGEGRWQCDRCQHIERLYNKPEVAALKHLFKSVVDKYDR